MNNRNRTLLSSIVMGIVLSIAAAGTAFGTGSFAGNGADHLDGEWSSAWFLGEKPVKWCIKLDPDFGLTLPVARAEIEKSFAMWRHYLKVKGLSDSSPENTDAPALFLNSSYQSDCNATTDLVFNLGNTNQAIEEWRQRYANPVAFSRATEYDLATGFGKGYVWIISGKPSDGAQATTAPDWSHLTNFRAITLHEIGHILGCRHIAGTIMAPDIATVIHSARFPTQVAPGSDPIAASMTRSTTLTTRAEQEKYDRYRTLMLEHIDYSRELFWRPYSGITLYNVEPLTPGAIATPVLRKMYTRLTGDPSVGNFIYQKLLVWRGQADNEQISATLYMADDAIWQQTQGNIVDPAVWRFDMLLEPIPREFMQTVADDPVFKRHWLGQEYPRYAPKASRMGKIIRISRNGQEKLVNLEIIFERNRGRFTAPQQWDPALSQMILEPSGSDAVKMFRAKFADQQQIPDGFFERPGGQIAP